MKLKNYPGRLAAMLIFVASAGGAGLASNPSNLPDAGPVLRVNIEGVEPARGGRLLVMLFGRSGFPQNHGAALVSVSRPLADRLTIRMQYL